jgi:DNA-3-methyladenine glycosylase
VVGGHDVVRERRGSVRERDWARGPGRLGQALGLSGAHSGLDFCRPAIGEPIDLVITPGEAVVADTALRTGPRVGVSGPGGDGTVYPWRFWIHDDAHVSDYRPGVVRARRG